MDASPALPPWTPLLPPLLRAWARSWRVRRRGGEQLEQALRDGPVVFVLFHEHLVPVVLLHRHLRAVGLVSRSRDGELLARVMRSLGYAVERGSSSRGGSRALRALLRRVERGWSPALAVDGPRGPRRSVQPGALALASLSGRPLALIGVCARPALRAPSWDRTLVPLPGARVFLSYELLPPPPRDGLEAAARLLEERLSALAAPLDG